MTNIEREQAITELLAVIDDNAVYKILNFPKIEYYERQRRIPYQSLPVEKIKLMTQRLQSLKKRTPQQEHQQQSILNFVLAFDGELQKARQNRQINLSKKTIEKILFEK